MLKETHSAKRGLIARQSIPRIPIPHTNRTSTIHHLFIGLKSPLHSRTAIDYTGTMGKLKGRKEKRDKTLCPMPDCTAEYSSPKRWAEHLERVHGEYESATASMQGVVGRNAQRFLTSG